MDCSLNNHQTFVKNHALLRGELRWKSDFPVIFPWCAHHLPMIFPSFTHDLPMIYPWCVQYFPMIPSFTHDLPMIYHDFPMKTTHFWLWHPETSLRHASPDGKPPFSYGFPMVFLGFPRFSYGFPKFSYGFPRFSYGFPKFSYGFPRFSYGFPRFSYGACEAFSRASPLPCLAAWRRCNWPRRSWCSCARARSRSGELPSPGEPCWCAAGGEETMGKW